MDRTTDEDNWLDNWDDSEDGLSSADPFEGLTKSDQDLFFRMLDLMPEEYRTQGMDYFMDHPAKIRAIIKNLKLKKSLIKNNDREGLNQLLAKEYTAMQQANQLTGLAADISGDESNDESVEQDGTY